MALKHSWLVLLLGGCQPKECGPENIKIVGGTAEEQDEVRHWMESFEEWTDEPVCLAEVRFVADLDSQGKAHGPKRSIQLREELGEYLRATVIHELCHILDYQHRYSDAEAFDWGSQSPSDSYDFAPRNHRKDRYERFAEWCELGPPPPMVPVLEASCGNTTPKWLFDNVWHGEEAAPFLIMPSATDRVIDSLETSSGLRSMGRYAQHTRRSPEEGGSYSILWGSDGPITVETSYTGWPLSADPEQGRVLFQDDLRRRTSIVTQKGQVDLAVGHEAWRGGLSEEAAYLWPESGGMLNEVDLATGDVSRTRNMAQNTYWFPWRDGRPGMHTADFRTRVISTLDGDESITVPTTFHPVLWSGDWLVGDYGYYSHYEDKWTVLLNSMRSFYDGPRAAYNTKTGQLVASPPCPTTTQRGGESITVEMTRVDRDAAEPWRVDLVETTLRVSVE